MRGNDQPVAQITHPLTPTRRLRPSLADMSRLRFSPDASDLAMLDRLWAGLASMVGVLVVLAASGGRISAGRKLARVAESLARRVLFAEAVRRVLPQVRPVSFFCEFLPCS